jgi:iron-sulfur cluster repair protein YtfE (RIC family)
VTDTQVTAVIETRLVHDLHRQASSLLVEATARPESPATALAGLRDFLVAQLREHHQAEDDQLWPMILAAAPALASPLADLSEEHEQLDAALDALEAAPADEPGRAVLAETATALRDLVHTHLNHEEPVIFPALREHVTEQQWEKFVEVVRASSGGVGTHLLVGFLERVSTKQEAEIVLGGMPPQARAALREQAEETFRQLGSETAGQ